MIIKHDGVTYYAVSRYEERLVLKEAGFWWNVEKRRWETSNLKILQKLISMNQGNIENSGEDMQIMLNFGQEMQKIEKEKSFSMVSNISVPSPKGLQYRPYQKAGIEFLSQHTSALIADEMGLGKTIEVIGYINLTHPSKILIISPKIAKYVWKEELNKWLVNTYNIVEVDDKQPPVNYDNCINLLHYEQLLKYGDLLTKMYWNVIVLDESHYIKNNKAKRTKIALLLAKTSTHKICLSGTPVMNKPIELYTQLKFLNSEIASSYTRFVSNYVVYDDWLQPSGGKNLDELQTRLRSTIMIRRMKMDVLTELPDKIRQIITIPYSILSLNQRKLEEQAKQMYKVLVEKGDSNVDLPVESNMVVELEKVSEVRHLTALAKLPMVIQHIRSLIEEGEKVVVFAHHHDVINGIIHAFPDIAVRLSGEDNDQSRTLSIQSFQHNDKIRIMVASMKAAGVAITLTAASVCIFAELDWTPSTITQAEDRLHRIGQKKAVQSQFLIVENTIDAMIAEKLTEKSQVIHQIVDIQKYDSFNKED